MRKVKLLQVWLFTFLKLSVLGGQFVEFRKIGIS